MKIGLLSETIRAEVLFITFNFDFSKVSIFTNFHIKINIKSINQANTKIEDVIMTKYVVAPDSFKESMTAKEVCDAMEK